MKKVIHLKNGEFNSIHGRGSTFGYAYQHYSKAMDEKSGIVESGDIIIKVRWGLIDNSIIAYVVSSNEREFAYVNPIMISSQLYIRRNNIDGVSFVKTPPKKLERIIFKLIKLSNKFN